MAEEIDRPTVRITNIPQTITGNDLLQFLESKLGLDSVYAVEIVTDRNDWKPRTYGRIQFVSLEVKSQAELLSLQNKLYFKSRPLQISTTYDDIIPRPIKDQNRVDGSILRVGFMAKESCFCVLETWKNVRCWVMPERGKVEFWVWLNGECYKLEVKFEDILESVRYSNNGGSALLLKFKYGPKIHQQMSGPDIVPNFKADRYHICKEAYDFVWVRTTDFSSTKSIGHSTAFYWEIGQDHLASDIFSCFPYYTQDITDLTFEDGVGFSSASEIVPLVNPELSSTLSYEVLFQINSLIHTQKISLAAADADLFNILSGVSLESAMIVLRKLHKLDSTCYSPLEFIETHLKQVKGKSSSSLRNKNNKNGMSVHRGLVTPSKFYCLGPELETSNYVVRNFEEYALDFMRVTFVEEDWSKLPPNTVSANVKKGIFAKPLETKIYQRVLAILKDGITIGAKRFEFLAFSASQLRSNSIWMFASNDKVRAEDIREWMGCFTKIRSIAKCAARMGQLFSSSQQASDVSRHEVLIIPDIEVTSDGVSYCFSDGIGKISPVFARRVARKCGLSHTPSAFQIRYGGYKGVVAVDQSSFRKMCLRNSMLKFESNNKMLNVTKWSESQPCFLNREIIGLLSTLGVTDDVFEAMQSEQLDLLGKMLQSRQAALDVLTNLGGMNSKNILVQMLAQGYEPNVEPYLSMMLQAHYENQLTDLKSRCRIFVPKGRVLIGCLDETGILEYGQVYIRLSMTKGGIDCQDKSCFHMVDDKETSAVIVGKVVVTKNPCLHPGDIRVLDAIYDIELETRSLVDCLVFPQKGERPHPNECSGGDLDGDLFFISWDDNLIPSETFAPMDYTGRRPRIMDHDVTLEEIHKFFVDYMINDNLGSISTAHLVHADREPDKAKSEICLQLANLHSMAVDFAKTGVPAEMPNDLKPKEFPDFMERFEKRMYISEGVLGKLYRTIMKTTIQERSCLVWSKEIASAVYDSDLEVNGFNEFIVSAKANREIYEEKMNWLMKYYGAESEDEMLTGNLRKKATYLKRDNRRYGDMKERMLLSVKNLQKEAKEWFECSIYGTEQERKRLASAWYYVTYHPSYCLEIKHCLSFPWVVGDVLLAIKKESTGEITEITESKTVLLHIKEETTEEFENSVQVI